MIQVALLEACTSQVAIKLMHGGVGAGQEDTAPSTHGFPLSLSAALQLHMRCQYYRNSHTEVPWHGLYSLPGKKTC